MIKSVHENSIECFHNIDKSERSRLVLSIYQREPLECFTDRQVASRLGFFDMNSVRPRISELIDEKILVECGKVRDSGTGKTVRLVKLFIQDEQIKLF